MFELLWLKRDRTPKQFHPFRVAHYERQLKLYTIVRIFINSSLYVLNLMLRAGRLAEVARTAYKVERACFGTTHDKKKSTLMVKFEVMY